MPQDAPEQPQIYLITPPTFEIDAFAPTLSAVLDGAEIACLRLAHASADADEVAGVNNPDQLAAAEAAMIQRTTA